MASVKFTDLTTEVVTPTEGTGVFDILLEKMEKRLQEQFDDGRITGSDFAMVYLGVMQEVLKSSIAFLLQKDKAAMEAAAAQATVVKQWGYAVTTDSAGDLVLGASTGTGIVDEQIEKARHENDLVIGQVAKIYADTALVGQRQTTETAQTVDPTGGLLKDKADLISAQTLGFKSDTKQKILKQMLDGYSATLAIVGTATAPEAVQEPYIDALVFEILNDVGSTAMTNSAAAPDLGA